MAAASRLFGLVVVPVGIRHFVFSQPSEAATLRRENKTEIQKENRKS